MAAASPVTCRPSTMRWRPPLVRDPTLRVADYVVAAADVEGAAVTGGDATAQTVDRRDLMGIGMRLHVPWNGQGALQGAQLWGRSPEVATPAPGIVHGWRWPSQPSPWAQGIASSPSASNTRTASTHFVASPARLLSSSLQTPESNYPRAHLHDGAQAPQLSLPPPLRCGGTAPPSPPPPLWL